MDAIKNEELRNYMYANKKYILEFSVCYYGESVSLAANNDISKEDEYYYTSQYFINKNGETIKKHQLTIFYKDNNYTNIYKKTKEEIQSIVDAIIFGNTDWIKI